MVVPVAAAPVGHSDIVSAFAPWPTARVALELEVYSQGRWARRTGDDLSEIGLDRGEAGAEVALGTQAAGELRVEAVRSAADGGALGIDGDSTVFRVKLAQVMARHIVGEDAEIPLILQGAFGFVPDPWLQTIEGGYTLKALSRTGSERFLAWPTSDLAMTAQAIFGPVRAAVSVGNGEGQRYPERNDGKTTTAIVEVVPLALRHAKLGVAGVVRDGSIGVASIRDRRFGGAATIITPWVRSGVDLVRALGIGDRADAEGTLLGGWAEAPVVEHLFVTGRGQTLRYSRGEGRQSSFGGAISVEPWREHSPMGDYARGRFRVWLAVDRVTSSGSAMPLPGADAGDETLVMLIASALAPFNVN